MVALRDPTMLVEKTMAIPQPMMRLLQQFQGMENIEDIAKATREVVSKFVTPGRVPARLDGPLLKKLIQRNVSRAGGCRQVVRVWGSLPHSAVRLRCVSFLRRLLHSRRCGKY